MEVFWFRRFSKLCLWVNFADSFRLMCHFILFYVQNFIQNYEKLFEMHCTCTLQTQFDFVYNDGAFILLMCFGKSNAFLLIDLN